MRDFVLRDTISLVVSIYGKRVLSPIYNSRLLTSCSLASDRIHSKQLVYVLLGTPDRFAHSLICYLLVLVLGMCFFAGGIKYSEQGFGASAFACLKSSLVDTKILD
jgi:hypothetical protein